MSPVFLPIYSLLVISLINVSLSYNLNTQPNKAIRKMSWPLDFIDAPPLLDGTLAGDLGFDPLGIAKSTAGLFALRESEIKHGRLALLAALGWPLSELYHYALARMLGLEDLLAAVRTVLALPYGCILSLL
jgi:Chlorophyll A-B binding protein